MSALVTIHPTDKEHWLRERQLDLTSTDIPALFGLNPYKTAFELWQEKAAGERGAFTENERMRWGNRLEAAIAETIAEDNDWYVRPMKEYLRLPGERLGASFDYRILCGPSPPPCAESAAIIGAGFHSFDSTDDALLEIKNVDWLAFKHGWTVDADYIEAPTHIELQVQHQLLVSGLTRAYIGVLVGGNDVRVIEREADAQVHVAIRTAAAAFWQSIADNAPPDPVMPDDAGAVIRLYSYAAPGKLLDARGNAETSSLLRQYKSLRNEVRDMEELSKVKKAEILQHIGDHEKVIADDGLSLSAVMVAPSRGTLVTPDMVGTYLGDREGYRLCRVGQKKP